MSHLKPLWLALLLFLPLAPVAAQDGGWSFDPGVLADGQGLLQRTPAREMDGLFQAVHGAMQDDAQSRAVCALFAPGADRSLSGLNSVASRLGPDSRQRFASAVANALLASMQAPVQPDDSDLAQQALKSSAVTAALLHDGFAAGFNADDQNAGADVSTARCQSLRWLLDAMQSRPLTERAAMTRMLLQQGLAQSGYATGS